MTYLKDAQVAERFGVHTATIHRWVKAGTFPRPIKLSPGSTRWREADLAQWERERANEAVARAEADLAHDAEA